jgi:uncharacterized metal-binding protein YceD (DUF177 family)
MSDQPFSFAVSVSQIPAGGRHFRVGADDQQRRAIAAALGITEVEMLSAELEVRPVGTDAFSVRGTLNGTVVQTDVVTLEPIRQELAEEIDLTLVPATAGSASKKKRAPHAEEGDEEGDERDVYSGGRIDLGAIIYEHLALGLDPYPRSPGVEFSGHVEDREDSADSPFAALAALKREPK